MFPSACFTLSCSFSILIHQFCCCLQIGQDRARIREVFLTQGHVFDTRLPYTDKMLCRVAPVKTPSICNIWNQLEFVFLILLTDWVCNLKHMLSNKVIKQHKNDKQRKWQDCSKADGVGFFTGLILWSLTDEIVFLSDSNDNYGLKQFFFINWEIMQNSNSASLITQCRCFLST